jgi:hypothetical protein
VLVECPHCYSKVLPMSDGRCPSCQKDTREAKKEALTKVQIGPDTHLPDVCVLCGTDALQRVDVREGYQTGDSNFLIGVLLLFRPALWFAADKARGEVKKLHVKVPVCGTCTTTRPRVRPTYVNFEQREMSFLVHADFADALREITSGK